MVLEAPPKVLAFLDDFWFQYVIDIGNAGPDKGKGGKYLVVPPGYEGEVPEGYFVARSRTFNLWLMGRGFKVDGDLKPGVESIKKNLRIYPLAQAKKNPPETKFINGSGVELNTVHANDFGYFEELNEIVQEEPSEALDPERLGLFASIGIEKGKAFAPDARMKKILTDAAAVGNATSRAILFRTRMKEAYFYRGSASGYNLRWRPGVFAPVRRAQSRCTDYVSLLRHRHHPGDGLEDGRDWLTIRRGVRRFRRQALRWMAAKPAKDPHFAPQYSGQGLRGRSSSTTIKLVRCCKPISSSPASGARKRELS